MQQTIVSLNTMKLVGITARTNNAAEADPKAAKIGLTYQKYLSGNLATQIKARKNPGTTFCVYTDYESDLTGDYTYFIGEEVTDFTEIAPSFVSLVIPAQCYAKFTSSPGVMPKVCIDMWQHIWQMSADELGGARAYIADFEVYDDRSLDPQNTVLDIYVGINGNTDTLVGETNITPLLKAFAKFEAFCVNDKTEQERAGIIQAFEYCFELAWKIMKRLLVERGKIAYSPRETFRMAALEGFIQNPEVWFDFIKKRNLTVHTYHELEASKVLSICPIFAQEIRKFLHNIEKCHL